MKKRIEHFGYAGFLIMLSLFLCLSCVYAQDTIKERMRERIKEKWLEKRQQTEGRAANQDNLGEGNYRFSLAYGGLARKYLVHIPSAYNKSNQTPLVLAFHGGGGNSEMMATDAYYNLISKSNKEGFIIAFPNGASQLRSGKLATWNAGNCCGYARDNNIDDVGFVKAIIDEMETKFNIAPKKIYAIGFSNGGMLSYRLACELTDKFKAIASVAGTENYDNCNPKNPISIMHIHAKDDGHVLFNGGAGPGAFRDQTKVCDFTSVPETISRWVNRNNCNKEPKRVMEKEGVYCDLYSGCDNGVEVKLCVTEKGGHSWPGGQKPREKADTPSDAISAIDEIWDFLKSIP